MATVNMSSISSKVNGYLKSNPGIVTAASRQEGERMAAEAGSMLVRCLEDAISSSGLNSGALAAIGGVSSTAPFETSPGRFEIQVSIDKHSRPSLAPVEWEGVRDMAALFNNGYDARGRVFGWWHGHYIGSLQFRDGAHFVQIGVNDFNMGYGAQYNAVATITSDRFN